MNGNTVSFVDLDLDYVQRDGKWLVVDEEEFENNAVKFGYPDELVRQARKELERLQERIVNKQFPFDGSIAQFIERIR
jgi:protein associated with RNAse G/E